MIRIEIAAACLILLAACATGPLVDQGTSVVTNTVAVPYAVPCVLAKDVPVLPKRTPIDVERATTDQLAAAYAADVEQFEEYAKAVSKILAACVKSNQKPGDPNVSTRPLIPH